MKGGLDYEGALSVPANTPLANLKSGALVLCLGWAPSRSEPDFSRRRACVVLGVIVRALKFMLCAEQDSAPAGPEILHIQISNLS